MNYILLIRSINCLFFSTAFQAARSTFAVISAVLPMAFVGATTLTAGWMNITGIYWPQLADPDKQTQGIVSLVLTATIMASAVLILLDAIPRWVRAARGRPVYVEAEVAVQPGEGVAK